ncbi:Gfo/Idh/MocA family oxidoreductase [Mesorhizobium sp. BAC0120]|uniref:Gfo/Idh/MocA family protein n=1 Tax=Mesorhizobium sp. BAC0120 TaxID=3090670 RepID=UPI00298C9E2C|nr:Gfo/Idh/MocA family oxidoreductase [Mesorhizobium sp. BAC0120]MDW6020495.1 Gfo/Idh/MocA family oxidoreductase [Mesorhizobium sp. BAC0120]
MTTLANHARLRLVGAYDRSAEQLQRFRRYYSVRAYASLEEVFADPDVRIVVNLTDPESHYEVSRAALEAGKHVYSEKPLAVRLDEAETLVKLAARLGLTIAGAPANALSAAHAAVADALAANAIGTPRLIYAEMEDGPVFRQNWRGWRSVSGAPWPGEHEFEIGCTLEHAGYALSWLLSLFGPVESLTAFSALAFPEKGQSKTARLGPDFSVGCLYFRSGAVARLTSGLAAPRDRSLTILGEKGTITVRDLWDHDSHIRIEQAGQPRRLLERLAPRVEEWVGAVLPARPAPGRRLKLDRARPKSLPKFPSRIDFSGGIAAQAAAISSGRAPFFAGDVELHVTEIALALSAAGTEAGLYRMRSSFDFPAAGQGPSRSFAAPRRSEQAA